MTANAARIVSDPWPATGPQPDQCGYIEGTAAPILSPVEVVPGGKRCNIDVNEVSPGAHIFHVFARSLLGGDSAKVPFTFTVGTLTPPGGLRIIP